MGRATHKPLPPLDPDLAATLIEVHWSSTPEGVREKLASFLGPPESEDQAMAALAAEVLGVAP